jgi:predicted RNase H-like nuclease (RuvC/YqgF family)
MIRSALLISLALPLLAAALTPPPLIALATTLAVILQSSDVAVIAALIGAIAGPIATFLIAARRFSGRVQTTEASDLWEESRSIREWSLQRINILNSVVARLEKRIDTLEAENQQLHAELNTVRAENNELRVRLERGVASEKP